MPFDAEYKLMATFHEMEDGGREVVRCFVKGAPDVLLARSSHYMDADGSSAPMFDENRQRVLAENDRLAADGLRVLAVAQRDFDPAAFDPAATSSRWSPTWSSSRSSASSTRRARRRRTRSRSATTPASASG